jgi:hypothetical protein
LYNISLSLDGADITVKSFDFFNFFLKLFPRLYFVLDLLLKVQDESSRHH